MKGKSDDEETIVSIAHDSIFITLGFVIKKSSYFVLFYCLDNFN